MTANAVGTASAYRERVDGADWAGVAAELDELGCAVLPSLLTSSEADELICLYDRDEAFRSTVTMGRHRFGEGEYRYFAYPLPHAVAALRASRACGAVAEGWMRGSSARISFAK